MALPKIGALIALDGEKEFKDALSSCNASLRNMKSELELCKTKFEGQANSLQALSEKHKVLNNVLEATKAKQKAANQGLEHAKESQKKIKNGLDELNKKYDEEKKKLDEVKKKYGDSSKEAKDQEKVVKDLGETIERGNKNYDRAETRIENWKAKLNSSKAEVIKANRALEENEKYLNEASNSADKCAKSIDKYGNKLDDGTSALERQGRAMNALSTTLASAGIAAGVDKIKDALLECNEASEQFGSSIAKVMTIADSNKVSMDKMKESILGVSNEYAQSAGEVSEATYQAISASVETSKAVGFVGDSTKAAVAGFTDTTTAVDLLTTVLNSYKKTANETSRVSDVLLTTQNLGKTSLGLLAGSMGKVIPLAAAYKVNLENLSTAYATMTATGISTDEAGTYIKANMQELGKTSSKVAKILKEETGKSFSGLMKEGSSLGDVLQILLDSVDGNVDAFTNLWSNSRAGIGALALMTNGAEGFNETLSKMENCAGATDEAFKTMTETAAFTDQRFQNSMNNMKIAIGDQLSPALSDLKNTGSDAFEWATDFVKENPAVVRAIAALVTGFTTLTLGVTGVAVAINVIKPLLAGLSGALLGPAGIAIAASSALVALATYIASTSSTYQTESRKMGDETKKLKNEISDLKKQIEETAKSQESSAKEAANQYQAYDGMVTRLYELANSGNKSNKTIVEMTALMNQLNESVPGLNLSIDQQTGLLNQNEQAVRKLISAQKDQAMQKVLGEQLVELYTQQAEAFEKQVEAAQQQGEITSAITETEEHMKALVEAQNEYATSSDNIEKIAEKYGVTNEEILNGQAALEQLNMELDNYKGAQDNVNKSETESKKAYEAATDAIEKKNESVINNCNAMNLSVEEQERYMELLKEGKSAEEAYAEVTGKTTDSTLAMAAAVEAGSEAMDSSTNAAGSAESALEKLRTKYEEIKQSIKESIEQKIDLFSAFDGGDTTSLDTMISNLDSQLEGLQNWKENMKTIAGEVGDVIGPELYEKLLELGPEGANTIQEVASTIANGGEAGQEKLKALSEKYAAAFDFAEEASTNLSATSAIVTTMLGKMSDDTKAADFTALGEAVKTAAENSIGEWDKLPDETAEALAATIEAAEKVGADIPDGLAEGIASGETDPADAVSKLQGGINTQLAFLSEMAEKAGVQIPQDIKDGIAAGGDSAVQAVSALVELLTGEQAKTEKASADAGKKASESMGAGMEGAASQVSTSASSVAAGGATAAYGQAGNFRKVGYDLTTGMAAGVQGGGSVLSSAVTKVVNAAFEAGKRAADSHSPSKRAEREIGKTIPWGAAVGVEKESKVFEYATGQMVETGLNKAAAKAKKKTEKLSKELTKAIKKNFNVSKTIEKNGKTVAKTASELGADIVTAASKYLDNYKVIHNVSLEVEKKYWEKIAKKVSKGTQAWYDAKKKIKDVKEDITSDKTSKKEYTVSGKALDEYKAYYKVSAKAEMDYWNIVRSQYKEGNAYRVEADKKYFEAKENYYSKLKELEDDYYEKCKEVKDKLADDIEEQKKTYEDAFNDRKDTIKSAFGLFDEFKSEAAAPEKLLSNMQSQVSGYALWMEQLQQLSARGLLNSKFMKELNELGPEAAATILSLNMMSDEQLRLANEAYEKKSQLAESQALEETEEIRRQTENKIRELQAAAQKELDAHKAEYDKAANELSAAIEKPLSDLANKAKTMGEKTINKYIKGVKNKATSADTEADIRGVTKQFTDAFQALPKAGKKIGKQTIDGILAGFKENLSIKAESEELMSRIETAMKKKAKINSPSKLFRDEIGKQIPAGVGVGIQEGAQNTEKISTEVIDRMLNASTDRLNERLAEAKRLSESVNSYGNIRAVSQLAVRASVPNNTINVDNSDVAKAMGLFSEEIARLGDDVRNMKLVLDTGVLVGEIAEDVGTVLVKG